MIPQLLPQPRSLTAVGGPPLIARRAMLGDVPTAVAALRTAAEGTLRMLSGPAGGVDVTIDIRAVENMPRHAYQLMVRATGIGIETGDPYGLLYAAQTLRGLWTASDGVLPQADVRDSPTFAVRAVYAESTRGADLMTYADWCTFVDQLATLRITHLGVALYGCWDLRHDADPSEFMFIPLDEHPALRSVRRLRTWDPHEEREVVKSITPAMFAGDFFGRLVSHARAQGIEIIPCFAGPGHTTLLPRVYPDMSARDDNGKPTGYGYCATHPAARARLTAVFTNLIDQHLRPTQITTLGAGGDEYYPIKNLDPADPLREISPWCRCSTCKRLTPGEQLLAYYQLIGPLLADAGIRMNVWHDGLVSLGVLQVFADWANKALPVRPIVSWWGYSEPLPDVVPTSLETWVTPTTGLVPCLAIEDHSLNIESWLRRGLGSGATGVYAYNTPDPINQKNYACLADLSWNLEGSSGAAGFKRRWCEIVCPNDVDGATLAYALAEQVLGDHSAVVFLLDHLFAYFSTSPAGVVQFPHDIIRALMATSPALSQLLTHWAAVLRRSGRELPKTRSLPSWPDPGATWRAEMDRLADHLELVADVVAAARTQPSDGADGVDGLVARGEATLRRIAQTRIAYQAPYVMREHWYFISRIADVLTADRDLGPEAAQTPWQAWRF